MVEKCQKQSVPFSMLKECSIKIQILPTIALNYSTLKIILDQLHQKDNWKTYIKHTQKGFHQTHFSDCKVTDKGPHHRCCYLEKQADLFQGSHHTRFHRNIFPIIQFQRKTTMHHWATIANFRIFLLLCTCYHKRGTLTWKTGRKQRTGNSTGYL